MNDERKTQREKLLSQRKNGYDRVPAQEIPAMERYCSLYKTFLHQGKTERECARVAVELAEKAGFKPYERGMELKPGDRIYRVNRGKSVMLAVIGKQSLEKGAQIVAEPAGFFIDESEGPLSAGELERAEAWAKALALG